MRDIKESDWKLFKPLRKVALDRFCERVLGELSRISSDETKTKHERYLAIYQLMQDRDEQILAIFDRLRRSTARQQLRAFRRNDLVTEQELRRFSPELVESVESFLEIVSREAVDKDDLSLEDEDRREA